MNKVILQGRLTADPNTIVGDNFSVSNFTLAVNRPYKNKETGESAADFIRCVAYNGASKLISQYVKKGKPIIVVGEWRTGSYTREDGSTVYTNECRVNEVHFIPGTTDSSIESNEVQNTPSLNSRVPSVNPPTQPVQQQVVVPQQPVQPVQVQQQFVPTPPVEEDIIPQAFDSSIDLNDEFPW